MLLNAKSRAGVFLDRDGTVSEEVGYMNHLSRLRIYPFAAEAIRKLNEGGLGVFIVTNQSGVSRGYFPESLVQEIHTEIVSQLANEGAFIDGIYYCTHSSADNCTCRKPATGMLDTASMEHSIDLKHSFVVGDRYGDIELAHRAGARGILVRTGYGEGELAWHSSKWRVQPHFVANDLSEAVDWIMGQPK